MFLYIHVPFCSVKCAYCSFYSLVLPGGGKGADPVRNYLAGLLRELRLWGERLGRVPVETVFFGGGTPSLLPAKALGGILEMVGKTFILQAGAEISAEANPDSALAEGWLFEARSAGVNRLSLGVQSFDDADLTRLGRIHDGRTAEAAFAAARMAGFANISLDLMWGLPDKNRGQAQRQWLGQLKKACALQPEHISAYGLTLLPGCALEAAVAAGELVLPTDREQSSLYLAGADFLESRGYMQYEISNYAAMGFECRHNLGYWLGGEYLGLGPAAASSLNGRRWTNAPDIAAWKNAVETRAVAADFEEADRLTRLKEMLLLRLRLNRGLDLKEWQRQGGKPFLKENSLLVAQVQRNGLAATRHGRFRLTRNGMLVSDTILAHFFANLDNDNGDDSRKRNGDE